LVVRGAQAGNIEHVLSNAGIKPRVLIDFAKWPQIEALECTAGIVEMAPVHAVQECTLTVEGVKHQLSGQDALDLVDALDAAGLPKHQFIESAFWSFTNVECGSGLAGQSCSFEVADGE
jgi:hypothetical protein